MVKNLALLSEQIRALFDNAVDDIEEYLVQKETGGNLADSLTETFMQGKVTISFDPETNELLLGRGPKLREEEGDD